MTTPYIQRVRPGNELHDLLLEVCVPDRKGCKSITVIARDEEVSTESVHKWVRRLSVPPKRAKSLVERYTKYRNAAVETADLVGGECELREITLEEFFPYIF